MPQMFLTRAGALALWIVDSAREGDNRARMALAGTLLVTAALTTGVVIQMISQVIAMTDSENAVGEIGRGQKQVELAGKPETIQDMIREMDADIDELDSLAREKTTGEAFAMLGIADETVPVEVAQNIPEDNPLEGRHDPFQPLITTGDSGIPMASDVEPGPLDFIQYVGVIGKPGYGSTGDAVAIIRVNDSVNNQSLVKRAGDSFIVNGQNISLQAVKPDEIMVRMGGEVRSIPMNTFVDTITTSTADDAPGGAAAGSGPPGAGGNGAPPENFEELAE